MPRDPARQEALAAIVLAAGRGRRMGGDKALLTMEDGRTLVEHHVDRLMELGSSTVIVVLRPEVAMKVRANIERSAAIRVVTARTSSQAESLLAGARALPDGLEEAPDSERGPERGSPDAQHVLVVPVDMMPPALDVARQLRRALVPPLLAVTPTHGGRGGHPVLCHRDVLARLARAARSPSPASAFSLRDVLAGLGRRRARIEVDDPSVLDDFDAPSDLPGGVRLLRRSG